MFMDTITSQSNSQNTNLSNLISLGSKGNDYGNFAPVNETKPEFKSSNDLGLSLGLMGGTAGAVGMQRGENIAKEGSSYDGYTPPKESLMDKYNPLLIVGVVIAIGLSIFSLVKKGK